MSSQTLGREAKQVYYKHLYYVFGFLCNVDYNDSKFIHAPTYTCNEVMRLLELASMLNVSIDASAVSTTWVMT